MAKFTRRQIVTGFSVIFLTLTTILAIFALQQTIYYALPIPSILGAFTVALPPLAGIALESIVSFQSTLAARGELHNSKLFQAINAAFLVYEAVLATLAGTYIVPRSRLMCPLEEMWQGMYHAKDGTRVGRIQDALDCCGLRSTVDRAFPFEGQGRYVHACERRYERTVSCLDPWAATERRVAIMMMAVPIAIFLWKIALFAAPSFDTSWLPSAIRLPNEGIVGGNRPLAAITEGDWEPEGEIDSLRDEVRRLNTDSNLATNIEGGRVRPSALIQDVDNWAQE